PGDDAPAAPRGGDPERRLRTARRELERGRADHKRVGGRTDERTVRPDHDVAVGARERRPRGGVMRRGDESGERDRRGDGYTAPRASPQRRNAKKSRRVCGPYQRRLRWLRAPPCATCIWVMRSSGTVQRARLIFTS